MVDKLKNAAYEIVRKNRKESTMKKKLVMLLLCGVMACSFTACGNGDSKGTEISEVSSKTDGKRSGEYKIDVTKQVTSLAEYNGIKLDMDSSLEVTEDAMNNYLTTLLSGYGAEAFEEDKDHDVVEKNDIVKVDYTGYKDGEKFQGGEAADQYLDVAGNCMAGGGTGFIEGFTDGLVGAKVGETVSSPCTFPENYMAEDLAGQDVVFEFKVKAICKPVTFDSLTDEKVKEIFNNDTLNTVELLKKAVQTQLEQNLYSQKVNEVKTYMLDNCEAKIPEDYLDARLNEYIDAYAKDNCSDTETLEDFLTNNYNISADEAKKSWKESLEEQIKTEFIFGMIAEKEKIEVDEEAFTSYVNYLISNGSGQFADENAVYEYYGAGNAKEGETYLRNQYLVNKAIDLVIKNATVNFTSK